MTEQLENAIGGVLSLADLRPSPETNHAMTALVDSVVDADAKNVDLKLSSKNTKIIRDLSASAETGWNLLVAANRGIGGRARGA